MLRMLRLVLAIHAQDLQPLLLYLKLLVSLLKQNEESPLLLPLKSDSFSTSYFSSAVFLPGT